MVRQARLGLQSTRSDVIASPGRPVPEVFVEEKLEEKLDVMVGGLPLRSMAELPATPSEHGSVGSSCASRRTPRQLRRERPDVRARRGDHEQIREPCDQGGPRLRRDGPVSRSKVTRAMVRRCSCAHVGASDTDRTAVRSSRPRVVSTEPTQTQILARGEFASLSQVRHTPEYVS